VIRLSRWRKLFATRAEIKIPLSSISRIEHDPGVRAHVRTGLRKPRRHGGGLWRLGVYHGLDGWSFWSIGIGRNAVLIEAAGERFRYVVIEVADPAQTVREVRAALERVQPAPHSGSGPETAEELDRQAAARHEPAPSRRRGGPRGPGRAGNGED
jgi:hypothetical protein